jgi:hypothetical protein
MPLRTIQTRVTVGDDRRVTLELPPEVARGEHAIVIVVESGVEVDRSGSREPFPRHDVRVNPECSSLRREDLYDDSGRGA